MVSRLRDVIEVRPLDLPGGTASICSRSAPALALPDADASRCNRPMTVTSPSSSTDTMPDYTNGASDSKCARENVPEMPRKHGSAEPLALKLLVSLLK